MTSFSIVLALGLVASNFHAVHLSITCNPIVLNGVTGDKQVHFMKIPGYITGILK